MSTPAQAPAAQQNPIAQDPELMQAGLNAQVEALVNQRDGALQSHANALSELRITQVMMQRAHAAAEALKADLAAAHDEIDRLRAKYEGKSENAPAAADTSAESAQTEQPAQEAAAS